MTTYVVIAYRWGHTNDHWYILGAWQDCESAVTAAEDEASDRGGKYGVTVYRVNGRASMAVFHAPSIYGEESAERSEQIEIAKAVGNRFAPIAMGQIDGEISREAMEEFIQERTEFLAAIAKAKELAKKKAKGRA